MERKRVHQTPSEHGVPPDAMDNAQQGCHARLLRREEPPVFDEG